MRFAQAPNLAHRALKNLKDMGKIAPDLTPLSSTPSGSDAF